MLQRGLVGGTRVAERCEACVCTVLARESHFIEARIVLSRCACGKENCVDVSGVSTTATSRAASRKALQSPDNAAHNLRSRPPRKRRAGAPLAVGRGQCGPKKAPEQAA